MPYKDQIVRFTGGIHDWIGEIDQAPHKMGKNWYRLKNPVMVAEDAKGLRMLAVQGANNLFKKYVDIRVPDDCVIEILTVDPSGDVMKAYKQESERKKSDLILPAGAGLKLV